MYEAAAFSCLVFKLIQRDRWTVFSVVGGGVFFGEFDCFEVWQLILQVGFIVW